MPDKPRYFRSRIPVSTLGNGHELAVVVHHLEGSPGGPTVGVSGGVHGDEPDTVEYVRAFIEMMKETPFVGTIVAVSCANPLAFEAARGTRPTT